MMNAHAKREILLDIARSGQPKPKIATPLGMALWDYTHKKKNGSYNELFDKEIRRLRPDWFIYINTAIAKRKELLAMAKNGEARPHRRTLLGKALAEYINKTSESYNADFAETIKTTRPDWFQSPAQRSSNKKKRKQKLLQMAQSGEPKPIIGKHPLGGVLKNYCCKSSIQYDSAFDSRIRNLRPDWFLTKQDVAARKKKTLLQLANNGVPKLSISHDLYMPLRRYTTATSKYYDLEFDREIRKVRPDWFVTNKNKEKLIQAIQSIKDSIDWLPLNAWWYILLQSGIKPTARHTRLLKANQRGKLSLEGLIDALLGEEDVEEEDGEDTLVKFNKPDSVRIISLLESPIFAGMDTEAIDAIKAELKAQLWGRVNEDEEGEIKKLREWQGGKR